MATGPAATPRTRPPLPVRLVRYGLREAAPARAALRRSVQSARRPADADLAGNEARDLDHQWQWSGCYAPLVTMYLDQFGQARACCQNTAHLLGQANRATLREIWDGAPAEELRAALGRGDLGLGCEFCAWQRDEVEPESWFLRTYDQHPVGWGRPRWPRQLEFAVSNTCNLQCVMCNGDWSSSIRAQREHRPALASAYPESFFEELVEFIPHLSDARFTGGEPFLGAEPQRIMDLLAEHGSDDLVLGVVTNGTVFNDRVARTLDRVKPWITVSFDGGTEEVYERVRVGASFTQVLANIDRFAAIVSDHGVGMNLTHCLMVDNWTTFPELLVLAEDRDLPVAINTVRFPERHSLYHLPPAELDEVVATLDTRTPEVERAVSGNRLKVWHEQLDALRRRATSADWPDALGVAPPRFEQTAIGAVPVTLRTTAGS